MRRSEISEKSENLYTNSDFRIPIGGHPRSLSGGVSPSVLGKTEKTFSDRFRSFRKITPLTVRQYNAKTHPDPHNHAAGQPLALVSLDGPELIEPDTRH